MTSELRWGAYGQQGEERQRQQQEQEQRQQRRRQELEQLRARVPAWRDGVAQVEQRLLEARAQHAAAVAETGRRWDELEHRCFLRQRGECERTPEGQPIMDGNHPEVAREKAAWEEARAAEGKALRRISNLEAEKAYYEGWIAQATGTT